MFQILTLASIVLLVSADQLFKYLAEATLTGDKIVNFIPGILQFRLVHNDAGAFGLFDGMKYVLAAVTIVIIIAGIVLLLMRKIKPLFISCCACAIIAGGAGNLIDRLLRGYVVDFIDTVFVNFPTYNFADCLITVGCFAIIGYEIYEIIKETKEKKNAGSVNAGAFSAVGEESIEHTALPEENPASSTAQNNDEADTLKNNAGEENA